MRLPWFDNFPSRENNAEQPLSAVCFKDFGGQSPLYFDRRLYVYPNGIKSVIGIKCPKMKFFLEGGSREEIPVVIPPKWWLARVGPEEQAAED
jgi:hypothetical protein